MQTLKKTGKTRIDNNDTEDEWKIPAIAGGGVMIVGGTGLVLYGMDVNKLWLLVLPGADWMVFLLYALASPFTKSGGSGDSDTFFPNRNR